MNNNQLVTIEIDSLRSQVDLVSKDELHSMPFLIELRNYITLAKISGRRSINVPGSWLAELQAAYIMLF